MFHQTFDLIDLPRLAALALIEILLSVDNAVILGVLSHSLPPILRKRALFIGVASAFVLRALALFAVSYILHSTWLELLGAAYLLYLSLHHFMSSERKKRTVGAASFWKTVLLIEFFDLAFALDSIVAGVAFIATPSAAATNFTQPKLWIVYLGGMLGVVAIRYAADFFSRLIDRFPRLESSAYLLVGWIGIKLLVSILFPIPYFEIIFWTLFTLILGIGFLKK